ncbi:MAG: hypothetical protein GY772_28895 [bacterium]|nr:hypothetical protein [bacterium]
MEWASDNDAAIEQANAWIAQTAAAQGWEDHWTSFAYSIVDMSTPSTWESAWSWFADDDAQGFYTDLANLWNEYSEAGDGAPDGWDSMGEAFASAAGTAAIQEQTDYEQSWTGIAEGTVDASVDQVEDLATEPETSPWFWLAAIAAGGFLLFQARGVGRDVGKLF